MIHTAHTKQPTSEFPGIIASTAPRELDHGHELVVFRRIFETVTQAA